jgi:TM2 domain-containing membrane protein YozV
MGTPPNDKSIEVQSTNNVGTSYLLWLACLLQIHGLHRFYNKQYVTGVLWLFTFGLFWVGQFADLFLMARMVEDHNQKMRAKLGLSPLAVPLPLDGCHLRFR